MERVDPRKKTLVRPSLIPTISNGMIGSGRFDTKSSIFAKVGAGEWR